jgi:acylphosphatase
MKNRLMLEPHMRLQVRYSGRVQGVGFRATCRSIASRASISGWVRNEDDGDVLLEIQGESEEVRRVLNEIARHMCRNILRADEAPMPDAVQEQGFTIAH